VDATPPKPRKPMTAGITPAGGRTRAVKTDAAFDIWLKRGLQQVYNDVAQEPVPPEILALIEKSRKR
jgi:hypothetical protein